MPDKAIDTADEAKVKEAKSRAAIAAKDLDAAFRATLGNRDGRQVIWWVLEQAGIYRQSFTGNSQTFFNEGKREVGLRLLDQVTRADPDAFVTMIKEFQDV